ncbi:AraC family transcriptional regulator, partial [Burkholderia stagnalis]
NLNLTEISTQYGFSSSSHFSNRFKKQFGYSPSQIRKN